MRFRKSLMIALVIATPLFAKPLNVMFITVDDMNWDTVGAFGSPVKGVTPNIDRLASEGLRFEHGHVTIAICQPTRAVWMTGRYPHNSGALGFNTIKPVVPTLPEHLIANGFITGILGKTEHVIPSRKKAFDYKRGRYEMMNGRSDKLYAQFATEFLEKAKASGKPFFFMVNAHDPHRPFDNRVPAEKRIAKKAETKEAKNKKGTKKKKRTPRQPYPAPSHIYQPDEVVVPQFVPDLPKIREEIAQYYSSARRADDVVGAVLKVLDEFGLRDSTIVVFKSDHGIPIPFAKTNVWRNSTRTPWIVRWPGTVKANSHDTEHMVAGVDLAPTLLDALDVKPMKGMDGRSFLPVLKGESQSGRDTVYTHINSIASKRDYTMRSVQDKRYGYIWNGWADGKTTFKNESQAGFTWKAMVAASANKKRIAARVHFYSYRKREEFYDYERDPDALVNLIDDPKHAARIKELRATLLEYMKTTNDIALDKFKATVN